MFQQCSVLLFFVYFLHASTSVPVSFDESSEEYLVVIMNNDLIFDAVEGEGDLPDVMILAQPEFGTIMLNADRSFTFTPMIDICEETDHFSYLINRSGGIDTVQVKIDILCEPLTVLSGFTPDDDGVNDYFTILGIQNFPNNSLAIFDANGKEVYYMKGYNNTWDGKLEDGMIAPESMYYYVFHDGANYHSGYIKIEQKI